MGGWRRRRPPPASVDAPRDPAPGWLGRQEALARLAQRQLFFVGGAPRSGTTWLQQLLDAHPDVSCGGEGLFQQHLALPLVQLLAARRRVLEQKNATLFRHTGGFPPHDEADADMLLATGVLLGLARHCGGRAKRAVGEKTPENVFLFPRLKRMFPAAKFIGIARDPRDVLASAWHLFQRRHAGPDERAAKLTFVRNSLPSLLEGTRRMIALAAEYPGDCAILTYETLRRAPEPAVAALFRFLGVPDDAAVVADCVARTAFARQTGGRPAGVAEDGAFFRKGVVGDWPGTLDGEMNALVLEALGWAFPRFGWTP
jgi:hypothetical protein